MSTSCSNTFPSMVTEPNCVSSILGSMLPSPPSPPRGGMYLHSACDAQRGARAAELCGHPGRGPRAAPDGAVPTYTLQASGRTAPTGRSGGRGDADGDQDYWCSGVKILLLLQHPHPAAQLAQLLLLTTGQPSVRRPSSSSPWRTQLRHVCSVVKSWPKSWGRGCARRRDHDQGDAEPGAVASSTRWGRDVGGPCSRSAPSCPCW